MNLQEIIVYIILAIVAIAIIIHFYRLLTGKNKNCNCEQHCPKTGCNGCNCCCK